MCDACDYQVIALQASASVVCSLERCSEYAVGAKADTLIVIAEKGDVSSYICERGSPESCSCTKQAEQQCEHHVLTICRQAELSDSLLS
jgi:hypothetical protein